ncbi:putative lysin [uncultured Caudovirales phage]|uniref:Putative lysin n=1 Tax=uncultured Caudovirales phage TaxID=2100421 RepID=A0A6J5S196_9CAUD|nr:putative lysin [uncultured Caudovirales phage]
MPQVPSARGAQVNLGVTPDARMSLPSLTTPDIQLGTPQVSAPTIRTPQIEVSKLRPAVKDPSAIVTPTLSDGGARQLIQMGNSLQGVGGDLMKVALQQQVKINATVVDDALDMASKEALRLTYGEDDGHGQMVGGYRSAKGWDAIHPAGGKPLDDTVSEAFEARVKDIVKDKIGNSAQRGAFDEQVKQIAARLRQGTTVWQSEQFDAYHTQVGKSRAETLTNEFALTNPGDRAGQQEVMGRIEQNIYTYTKSDSPEAVELAIKGARGAAVAKMFDTVMADKKYNTAQALLNEWAGKIDPDTTAKMKASLDGKVSVQTGEQLADDALRMWAKPAYSAGDTTRGYNIVRGMESATGQVDKGGKLVVSPKGAYGAGQLMPDTAEAMAKKIGHPELYELSKQPTRDGEAANLYLGKLIYDQEVTFFKGDQEKAMAAYNAGRGWLIGGKDTKGNKIEGALNIAARTGTDWRTHLPAETQSYIRNGVQRLGAGEGAPAKPKKTDLYAAVDERTTDPDVRRAAYNRIDRQMAALESDEREGHENAFATALTKLQQTGGNVNALSPEEIAAMKPQDRATAATFAKNLAEGDYRQSDTTGYWEGMAAARDPKTTPAQLEAFRPRLSSQDFAMVRNAYLSVQKPDGPGQAATDLDYTRSHSLVDEHLKYLGINPTPTKQDTAGMARMSTIRQFTDRYLLDLQAQRGKKFTDAEMEQEVTRMFTRNQAFKETWAFGSSSGQMNVMSAEMKDIPSDTRDRLTKEFQRVQGRKPQPQELQQMYLRSQFYDTAPRAAAPPRINWGTK